MSLIVTNQFLTVLSDLIFTLAIMWHVYEVINSVLSTSLIMAIVSLTSILIGPFIGVLVDRREPKTSMQIGDALMILVGIGLTIAGALLVVLVATQYGANAV